MIAIIAVLASMLLPSLRRAKAKAQTIGCLNNQRQIGVALYTYSADSGSLMPAAVEGHGNYHTSQLSRFDYAFGGEFCNGGLWDVGVCTEEAGGSGRSVATASAYPSGRLPKNFGDALCDDNYATEGIFYCGAHKPEDSRGYQLTNEYDTGTSPWTPLPDASNWSKRPHVFSYGYLVTLTNYSWDWSNHGELPGQKAGTDGVDIKRRQGVCDPWRLQAIRYPAVGVLLTDNAQNLIDVNYYRDPARHDDGTTFNSLHYDGHVSNHRRTDRPFMFLSHANQFGASSSWKYHKYDPDGLWRPWIQNFPLVGYYSDPGNW